MFSTFFYLNRRKYEKIEIKTITFSLFFLASLLHNKSQSHWQHKCTTVTHEDAKSLPLPCHH